MNRKELKQIKDNLQHIRLTAESRTDLVAGALANIGLAILSTMSSADDEYLRGTGLADDPAIEEKERRATPKPSNT